MDKLWFLSGSPSTKNSSFNFVWWSLQTFDTLLRQAKAVTTTPVHHAISRTLLQYNTRKSISPRPPININVARHQHPTAKLYVVGSNPRPTVGVTVARIQFTGMEWSLAGLEPDVAAAHFRRLQRRCRFVLSGSVPAGPQQTPTSERRPTMTQHVSGLNLSLSATATG